MLWLYAVVAVVPALVLLGVLYRLGVRSRRREHAREVLLRAISAVAAAKDSWDRVSWATSTYGCSGPHDLESFLAAVGEVPGRTHLRTVDETRLALTRAAEHAPWLRPYYLDNPDAVHREADRVTARLREALAALGRS